MKLSIILLMVFITLVASKSLDWSGHKIQERDVANSNEASDQDSLESDDSSDSDDSDDSHDIKSNINYLTKELKKLGEKEEKHKQKLEHLKRKLEEEMKKEIEDQEKILRKAIEKSQKEEKKDDKKAEHERKHQNKEQKNGASNVNNNPKNDQAMTSSDQENTKRFLMGRVPILWAGYNPDLWNIPNPQAYNTINNPTFASPNPQSQYNLETGLGPQRPGIPMNYPYNLLRPFPWNNWNSVLPNPTNPNVNQQWQPSIVNNKPGSTSANDLPNSVLVVPQTQSEQSSQNLAPENTNLQIEGLNVPSNNGNIPVPGSDSQVPQTQSEQTSQNFAPENTNLQVGLNGPSNNDNIPVPASDSSNNFDILLNKKPDSSSNNVQTGIVSPIEQASPNSFGVQPDSINQEGVLLTKPSNEVIGSPNQNPDLSNTAQNETVFPVEQPNFYPTNIGAEESNITGYQNSLSNEQQSTLPLQTSSVSTGTNNVPINNPENVNTIRNNSDISVIPIQNPNSLNNNSEIITGTDEKNNIYENNQSPLTSSKLNSSDNTPQENPTMDDTRRANSSDISFDNKTSDSMQNIGIESNTTSLTENSPTGTTNTTSDVLDKTSNADENNLTTIISDTNIDNTGVGDLILDNGEKVIAENSTIIDNKINASNIVEQDVISTNNASSVVTNDVDNSTLDTLTASKLTQSNITSIVSEVDASNNSTASSPDTSIVPESDLISPDLNAEIVEVVNEPSFSNSEPSLSDSSYNNVTNSSSLSDTPSIAA